MRSFRHIRAWQRAHALSIEIHKLTRDFGRRGHANLRSQLNKAAESIAGNIVEGCGAASHKEFARYLDISIKSANETEYHLQAAYDHGLISRDDWTKYTAETVEVRKMVYGYREAILRDEGGPVEPDDSLEAPADSSPLEPNKAPSWPRAAGVSPRDAKS